MSKPIAPKAGYDTDIKAKYREQVWDAFAPGVAGIIADTTGTLKAVIMPSAEGLEIEVALSRGLREEQIVCVDRSAAVIATSKWRKRWPDVKFFASEVSAVGDKIAKAGWAVRVANLDLCGNFSDDTIDAVRGFLSGAPLAPVAEMAVTIAKGREGSALTSLLKAKGFSEDIKDARMGALFHLTGLETSRDREFRAIAEGAYTSGRQPMAWCVAQLKDSSYFNAMAERERAIQIAPLMDLVALWKSEFQRERNGHVRRFPSLHRFVEIEQMMEKLDISDRQRRRILDHGTYLPSQEEYARFYYAHMYLRGRLKEYFTEARIWADRRLSRGDWGRSPREYLASMSKQGYCREVALLILIVGIRKGDLFRGFGRYDHYVLSSIEGSVRPRPRGY